MQTLSHHSLICRNKNVVNKNNTAVSGSVGASGICGTLGREATSRRQNWF